MGAAKSIEEVRDILQLQQPLHDFSIIDQLVASFGCPLHRTQNAEKPSSCKGPIKRKPRAVEKVVNGNADVADTEAAQLLDIVRMTVSCSDPLTLTVVYATL